MMLAPIALFVYNRPHHLMKVVDALKKNAQAKDTPLVVFSDGAKTQEDIPKVEQVRQIIRHLKGFKHIECVMQPHNRGLAQSIIAGVTELCQRYGRVIVLEDDLVVSPYFLDYMNHALQIYYDAPNVSSIQGYCYPVQTRLPETYFLRGADCWGWATWAHRWDAFEPDGLALLDGLEAADLLYAFDFEGASPYGLMLKRQIEGKLDSWAIRWHALCYLKAWYALYPGRSLVQCIGHDNSGAHCANTDEFDVTLSLTPIRIERHQEILESDIAYRALVQYYRSKIPTFSQRVARRAASMVKAWIT